MNRPGRHYTPTQKISILGIILFTDLVLISSQVMVGNQKTLLHHILTNLITPIQLGIHRVTSFVGQAGKQYVFLHRAYRNYQEAARENSRLQYENYLLRQALRDQELRQRVAAKTPYFKIVEVISIDPNFPFDTLRINQGSHHGIQVNQVVLNPDGDLVGRVVEPLNAFSASVRLLTSPTGGTGAIIGMEGREGLLTGTSDGRCHFNYLMENKPVKSGDWVYSSGTDMFYPPYLPIGRVILVERDYLTQKITVKPFFIEKPLRQLVVLTHE